MCVRGMVRIEVRLDETGRFEALVPIKSVFRESPKQIAQPRITRPTSGRVVIFKLLIIKTLGEDVDGGRWPKDWTWAEQRYSFKELFSSMTGENKRLRASNPRKVALKITTSSFLEYA